MDLIQPFVNSRIPWSPKIMGCQMALPMSMNTAGQRQDGVAAIGSFLGELRTRNPEHGPHAARHARIIYSLERLDFRKLPRTKPSASKLI